MLKIYVWERANENSYKTQLRNLRPRNYMCGWSFERMLKYISEELYWEDIKEEDVSCIEIANEEMQWLQCIPRESH